MENSENEVLDDSSFVGNSEINNYLLETSKWGKFLAIIGFVGMGIMILVAISIMSGSSQLSRMPGVNFPMGILGLVYIVIAVLYYFPIIYLYRFSIRMKQGISSNDLPSITAGFSNLKSLFKFMGIFTIVILSFYLLILLIAIPSMLFLRQ